MAKSPTKALPRPLNAQQLRFAHEYLVDQHGTKAAIRAGYSKKTADSQASQLLRKTKIQEIIQEGLARQLRRIEAAKARAANKIEVTETKWLEEVAACAFTNMDDFATVDDRIGVVIIPTEERHVDGRAIRKVSESIGKASRQQSIELHNKLAALEIIGKHKGFIKNHNVNEDAGGKRVNVNITLPTNGREVKPKAAK